MRKYPTTLTLIGFAICLSRAQVLPDPSFIGIHNTVVSTAFPMGNLVSNGTFENDWVDWTLESLQPALKPANSYAYTGLQYLHLNVPAEFNGRQTKSSPFAIKPGVTYTLWLRYKCTGTAGGDDHIRPGLDVFSSPETFLESIGNFPQYFNNGGWTHYGHTFTVPAGAAVGQLVLVTANSPTPAATALSFDDIVLVEGDQAQPLESGKSLGFFDGFNRPVQSLTQDLYSDIITETHYDNFGRPTKSTLPLGWEGGHSFVPDVLLGSTGMSGLLGTYYGSGSGHLQTNGYPYSETEYETSPLGRVKRILSPGLTWRSDLNRSTTYHYGSTYSVPSDWPVDAWDVFSDEEQFVTLIDGEGSERTREFKDRLGRVVRKEVKPLGADWISTDYTYDGAGNLTSITSPLGEHGRSTTSFEYNSLGQLLSESSNDFGRNDFIYDSRGRLRFKKSPEQNSIGEFTYLKYDELDRVIETGVLINLAEFTQSRADESGFPGSTPERRIATVSFYDEVPSPRDYCGAGITGNTFIIDPEVSQEGGQNFSTLASAYASVKDRLLQTSQFSGEILFVQVFASVNELISPTTGTVFEPLTTSAGTKVTLKIQGVIRNSSAHQSYAIPFSISWGPLKGRLVKSVSCNQELAWTPLGLKEVSTTFNYDKRGNVVEVYDYNGYVLDPSKSWQKTIQTYDLQNRMATKKLFESVVAASPKLEYRYSYDQLGRLNGITDGLNQTLMTSSFNSIGQLSSLTLGKTNPVQIDYKYHFRGWLKEIEAKAGTQNVFKQVLKYETGEAPQYNGNISEYTYEIMTQPEHINRFQYDAMNRLINSVTSNIIDLKPLAASRWLYNYHPNGSIDWMERNGDRTNYFYAENTNQLDHAVSMYYQARDMDEIGSFVYDRNGRLIDDHSKGMRIFYDEGFDRPYRFNTLGSEFVEHYMVYGSDGSRKSKLVIKAGDLTEAKHYFSGGLELREELRLGANGSDPIADYSRDLILPFEGYGRVIDGSEGLEYEIDLKNHLGSTVDVYNTSRGAEIWRLDYEPYGKIRSEVAGATDVKQVTNKFTGKEHDRELGLDYFGARYYDADLGLWISPDAARQHYNPYTYGSNNPVNHLDPDGRFDLRVTAKGVATDKPDNGQMFGPYEIGQYGYTVRFLDVDQLDLLVDWTVKSKVKEFGKIPKVIKKFDQVINLGTKNATDHSWGILEYFFDLKVKGLPLKLNEKEVDIYRREGFTIEEAKELLLQMKNTEGVGEKLLPVEELFKGIDEKR